MKHAFTGGRVLTMAVGPVPDVVIVEGDRITAVGERGILSAHPDAQVHDLAGRTLVPGFIDAHNHLSIAALHPQWHDVSHVTSMDELLDGVRAQAVAEPEAEWIRVCGWNESTTGVAPTRVDLDALGFDRPIVVAHFSLHQAVVCSRGLADLGIGRTTADPVGGELGRGADGEPNGLLIERAWSEAHARSLAGFTDRDRWGEYVLARIPNLLRYGITAIHDAACSSEGEDLYRWLARERGLPLSVLAMPHSAAVLTNDVGPRIDGPTTGEGDEAVRVGGVKFFADGGIAIALDVAIHGQPLRMGITMDDLEPRLVEAARRGYRVGVHAMGNVGVQRTIEAFAAARRAMPDEDHRFRIEHVGVASKEQCQALAALGAVAVVQPGFVDHVGESSDGVRFDEHAWLPFATLAEAGVPLAASSDDPCAPFPPLWCSARGATRTTVAGNEFEPDQAVDFEAWLYAYTAGSAYAGGQEHERGSITPGLRADLVVLDGALDAYDPPRVAETWVGGVPVYIADGSEDDGR